MDGTRRTARNIRNGYDQARDKRNGKPIITERPIGILERRHVLGSKLAKQMSTHGHYYDYNGQTWRNGQDHAHVIERIDHRTETVDIYYAYCGSDLETCRERGS